MLSKSLSETMKIQMVDVHNQYLKIKDQVDQGIQEVIDSSIFIKGPKVHSLETALAEYLNVKQVIGCANGTDALQVALMALDLCAGDEIIVPQAVALSEAELQKQAEFTISRETITVNVVGEVVTPGAVQVKPNTPLNQAILAAGGFDSSRANQGSVELVRLNLDGTVNKREIQVDLASGVNEETNPILKENDVVVVGRGGLATVADTVSPITGPLGILRLFLGF